MRDNIVFPDDPEFRGIFSKLSKLFRPIFFRSKKSEATKYAEDVKDDDSLELKDLFPKNPDKKNKEQPESNTVGYLPTFFKNQMMRAVYF